jgi:hypothetical protein
MALDDAVEYVNDLGNDAAAVQAVEVIEGLFFTVQVGAFSRSIQADNVFNVSPLVIKNINGLYKYSTGIFRSVQETMERKNEMISKGLVGAFITAYYNGEKVTITEANQLIVEKGDGVFAISVDGVLNKNDDFQAENIPEAISSESTKMITVTPTNIDENQIGGEESDTIPVGLMPTPVDGLEYRVFLGSYLDGVPQARSMVFVQLDYLGIESTAEGESITYYCGNKDLYSEAEILLKNFTDQGVGIAKIVSFQNGEEIDVNEARQLTHE